MRTLVAIALSAGILVCSSWTGKAIVICDPDEFADGTLLNTIWPGITLTALDDPAGTVLPDGNVYAVNSTCVSTGMRGFGNSEPGLCPAWGNGNFDYLRVDFSMGATEVYLDFVANDAGGDANPYINAYDAGGNLVDSDTVSYVAAQAFATLSVSHPDIAYIEASWDMLARSQNGSLDNLRYEPASVPDASSALMLLTVALLGLGALSRSKN